MSKVAIIYDSAMHNHHELMPSVFLEKAKNVNLKRKVGGAFCSNGWSPEVVDMTKKLKEYGLEKVEGLLIHEKPDEIGLEK